MRRGPWATGLLLMGSVVLAGCPSDFPHRGASPRPTIDPGDCWPEPALPEHSLVDGCNPKDELDYASEPNGTLPFAATVTGAGMGAAPFTGSLGSGDDVDIFLVPSFDLPFTSMDPLSRTTQRTKLVFQADSDSRMCAFFSCTTGVTSLDTGLRGCDGSANAPVGDVAGVVLPAHLQEGMLGCCRSGSGTLIVGTICDNTSPTVNGFITVESIGPGACNQAYSVTMSLTD